jgi:hypothetical protein
MHHRGAVVLAVIASIIVAAALAQAKGTFSGASGAPLTKEQYFQKSIEFGESYSATEDRYYAIALKQYPNARCISVLKRYRLSLSKLVAAGEEVSPPPEIAALHGELVGASGRVVRRIGDTARLVARGKLLCGDQPKGRDLAKRIYRVFRSSPIDRILADLRAMGYIPSGA